MPTAAVELHTKCGGEIMTVWAIRYPVTSTDGQDKALAYTQEGERLTLDLDDNLREWFYPDLHKIHVEAVRAGMSLRIRCRVRTRDW